MGTRVDLCVFFCFNVKIPFTSCDSYGYSLVARWWLVCWSTEHHYYWKNCLWKTPFSNQYFVLCPWYLITLSMRLGIDSMPLSIISVGKAKTVWIILFENWLKVSLVRFLLTASSLSFLPIRWKTFSIRLRSGERAGILKKWHPTFSIAYLHTLRFFERSLSWKNNLPFLKHIRKLFFDKLYKLFSINSPFVLVTFNTPLLCDTPTMNFATRPPEPSFFPLRNTPVWGLGSSLFMFSYEMFLRGMLDCFCGPKKYHHGRMIYLLSRNLWAIFCFD